jgi:CheY-like chemotaxis protein
MHALIIEPQAFTACVIEDVLRDIGYTSFAFAVGADDAVAAAEACPPDLVTAAVILDPGCGIAAARRICRARPTPVVFVTQEARQVRRREPEAALVLKQPLNAALLADAVAAAKSLSPGRSLTNAA